MSTKENGTKYFPSRSQLVTVPSCGAQTMKWLKVFSFQAEIIPMERNLLWLPTMKWFRAWKLYLSDCWDLLLSTMLALPGQWLPRESSSERYNDVQANWKDDASYYLMSGSSSFLTSAQVSSFLPWLEAGECWMEFFLSIIHRLLSDLFQDWTWRSSLWARIPGIPLSV